MTSTGEQIVNRFVTTLNQRDFDGFEALFVDDYQQHQALATHTGNPAAKHAVHAYYQDRITAFPDMAGHRAALPVHRRLRRGQLRLPGHPSGYVPGHRPQPAAA